MRQIKSLFLVSLIVAMAVAGTGCQKDKGQVKGFVLPEGNVDNGKSAFVVLGCHQCHNVSGVEMPAFAGERPFEITLGGEVLRVKSYGDLLTAVVHPNHDISRANAAALKKQGASGEESPMPDTTGEMTVAQLIDVVAFLHSTYERTSREYTGYVF